MLERIYKFYKDPVTGAERVRERAYTVLEIKSVDEDQWVIEGIASTPTPDRYGDIVEPLGAEFSVPMPLLWQHQADKPVGHVEFAKPNAKGIPFRARILKASNFTSEVLKERALEAWESVKTRLVGAVSIGFTSIEHSFLKEGGIHFHKWAWLELSLVTLPAQVEATISNFKSFDLAATGTEVTAVSARSTLPGASGTRTVKLITPKPRDKMTITERIGAFEAKRAATVARMAALTEKAGSEGRTKDESEQEEFDTARDEIKSIDRELVDLRDMEALNVTRAVPVNGTGTQTAAESRSPTLVVKAPEKLAPGIEFARFAMCVGAAKGDVQKALRLHETYYPQQVRGIAVLRAAERTGRDLGPFLDHGIQTKANVVAGTTTDATWAEPLVAYNQFAGDFVEFLRPLTIIGQFGQNGVPALRRIPFNVHIRGQTSGGTGYWVGEGKPKPVTKFDYNDAYHGFYKVAAISVLTEELIRFSDPSAEMLVRDALAGALIQRIDTTFIDYTVAAVAGVSPAAITNGVTPILSGGDTEAYVRTDVGNLWEEAIGANLPLTDAVYITTPSIALALSLMINSLGQPSFPGLTMRGGTLLGVPAIVSNNVPAGQLALVFASEIWLSDDGSVTVDASREASIQMLDNPTNDSVTPTATTMVSMFQTNSVALRAERFINWSKRRATAVALLRNVSWGGAAES